MLCATVKAVTVNRMRFQPRTSKNQSQNEDKVVDAEKNVLKTAGNCGSLHLFQQVGLIHGFADRGDQAKLVGHC